MRISILKVLINHESFKLCSFQYERILHKLSKLKVTVGVIPSDPPILELCVPISKVPFQP